MMNAESDADSSVAKVREKIVKLIEAVHSYGGCWHKKFPEVETELWQLLHWVEHYAGQRYCDPHEWPPLPGPPVVVNLRAAPMRPLELAGLVEDLEGDLQMLWSRPFTELRRSLVRLKKGVTLAICD